MGPWSGYCGDAGRRVQAANDLLPLHAPDEKSLGLLDVTSGSTLPLHIKKVTPVRWEVIQRLAKSCTPALVDRVAQAISYVNDDANYSPELKRPRYKASFTVHQIAALVAAEKIEPATTPKNWVNAFLVVEAEKERQRPIFEPRRLNEIISPPPLRYPSRLQRRWAWTNKSRFVANMDFAAYFDAFVLSSEVRDFFCFVDAEGKTWRLTRLPMGARWAPFVAQTVTWVLVFPFLSRCRVSTTIDNIRMVGDVEGVFVAAVAELLGRIAACNITLNDDAVWADRRRWEPKCREDGREHTYCGEVFCRLPDGTPAVRNTEKLVVKLRRSSAKWLSGTELPTIRNIMALVGLLTYMGHTLHVRVCNFFDLIRGFSALAALPSKGAKYDDVVPFLSPSFRAALRRFSDVCLANVPVAIGPVTPPSMQHEGYDATVLVDACSTGVGAYIKIGAKVYEFQRRWARALEHSATAEPAGISAVMDVLPSLLGASVTKPRIAFVTDHQAITMGQERWYAQTGGYGFGVELNNMFQRTEGCTFFFVPGECNLADGISRSTGSWCKEVGGFRFPSLENYSHPYVSIPERDIFMV